MRKAITINIPKPCHEDWNKMTLQEKGRHCQVCEKTVFDFTKTTDEAIVKTFEQTQNICGRFKSTQLNRELAYSRKDKNSYLSFIASSVFAFLALGTNEINAQGKPKIVQTDSVKKPIKVKRKIATSILPQKTITGNVISESDGLPLPGVNVIIKGTSSGVQTDFDGNFTIAAKKGDTLVLSYIGQLGKEVIITSKVEYNMSLDEDENELLGEVTVVGYSDYNYNFEESKHIPTAEELEVKRKKKQRLYNYFNFYKRKNKEEKEAKKLKRQIKRKNKNK